MNDNSEFEISEEELREFIKINKNLSTRTNSNYSREFCFSTDTSKKVHSYNFDETQINIFEKVRNAILFEELSNSKGMSFSWNFPFDRGNSREEYNFLWFISILKNAKTIMQYFLLLSSQYVSVDFEKLFNFLSIHTIYKKYNLNTIFEKIKSKNLFLIQARESAKNGQYNVALISMRSYIADFLKEWIEKLKLDNKSNDDNIKTLFGIINKYLVEQIEFKSNISKKILANIGKIADEAQDVRNQQSVAHANNGVLSNFESRIIYESLEYLIWVFDFIKKHLLIQNDI